MAIPSGIILIWTGTNATIPTGWSRETTLDDKFPKAWGAAVAPNTTGGTNTHTHTGAHTHTLTAHTHTFASGEGNENSSQQCSKESSGNVSKHTHSTHVINATQNGSLQSTTVTWSSVNQEPPYHTVIFIKPSAAAAGIAAGICTHYYGATAPTGWNFCNGSNSTPDLRDKYLKGAATGANAGTSGGGATHVHTVTHGHTADAHGHTGYMTGIGSDYGQRGTATNPTGAFCAYSHTHVVTLANSTDSVSNYTNTTAGGDTVEPAYKKLGVIKNSTGNFRVGMVGLWLGAVASIPTNWNLCDGNNSTLDLRDKFVKIGASLANNNETGGANTHTHSAVSHSHTTTGTHTHTGTHGLANLQTNPGGTGDGVCYYDHVHAITSISSTSASYSSDNITVDTVNNEPVYRTAAYIQLNKIITGASLLLNFI